MGHGIECSDWWLPILEGLCEVLILHGRETAHTPLEATQVKEKLGGLRFYARNDCAFCRGAIDFACAFSYRVCEKTGRPGILMNLTGGLRTLAKDVGEATGYQRHADNDDRLAESVHPPEDKHLPNLTVS